MSKITRKGKTNDEHMSDLSKKATKALTESMLMIEADAKLLVGVDTGHLRRNITHDVRDEGDRIIGQVGSNVEYAYLHELKNPYLETAIDQNLEQIRRKVQEVLSK